MQRKIENVCACVASRASVVPRGMISFALVVNINKAGIWYGLDQSEDSEDINFSAQLKRKEKKKQLLMQDGRK